MTTKAEVVLAGLVLAAVSIGAPARAEVSVGKPAAAGKTGAVIGKPAAPAKKPATKLDPRGVAVVTAPAIVPAADLLATAKRLRDAAAAKDGEAVAALIADEVTVVSSSLDLAAAPSVTREGPYTEAADLLAVVGRNAGGGGDVPPGTPKAVVDERLQARAFAHIVASIDAADWGRDPRVKGGFCTHRGRTWNAAAVRILAKGPGAVTGGTVAKAVPVRTAGHSNAGFAGTLAPGLLYLEASEIESPEGWRAVRLPTGRVGFVEGDVLRTPTTSGICFLPNVDGGWLMSAVVGVGP